MGQKTHLVARLSNADADAAMASNDSEDDTDAVSTSSTDTESQSSGDNGNDEEGTAAALAAELRGLKMSALRQRALDAGVPVESVLAAYDEDDAAGAMISLIVGVEMAGFLSHDEIRRKLRRTACTTRALFSRHDYDNSGSLGFTEFKTAIREGAKVHPTELSDTTLQKVFAYIDCDGSGELCRLPFATLRFASVSPPSSCVPDVRWSPTSRWCSTVFVPCECVAQVGTSALEWLNGSQLTTQTAGGAYSPKPRVRRTSLIGNVPILFVKVPFVGCGRSRRGSDLRWLSQCHSRWLSASCPDVPGLVSVLCGVRSGFAEGSLCT